MKTIIIREHKTNAIEIISNVPDHVPAVRVVELWQKRSIYFQVHGTFPPITWKAAEKPSIIDALIESTTGTFIS